MKQEKDLKIFLHKINKLYSTKMIRYVVVDSQKLLRSELWLIFLGWAMWPMGLWVKLINTKRINTKNNRATFSFVYHFLVVYSQRCPLREVISTNTKLISSAPTVLSASKSINIGCYTFLPKKRKGNDA